MSELFAPGTCPFYADPLYVDDEPREPLAERDKASFWLWVATMRAVSA